MSDLPEGFQFGDYVLRPALPRDLALAAEWVAEDPFHQGIDPAFWIEQVSGLKSSFVLEELYPTRGPILFFQMELRKRQQVQIYIQFGPMSKMRRLRALVRGWQWLKRRLTGLRYEIVSFRSKSEAIHTFAKGLGFECSDGTLWYLLQREGLDVRTDRPADRN